MYKYLIIGLLMSVLAVGAAWFILKPDIKEDVGEVVAPAQVSMTPVTFVAKDDTESVFVTFGTSTALLNGSGYNNLLLTQVESASGAKYESTTENLTVWNKGEEVTITRGRKIIFTGLQIDSLPQDSGTATTTESIATTTLPLAGEWVWLKTVVGESTRSPEKPGVFSVSFSEGKLSGTTDCNGFNGTYERVEDTITISALATTKMFCEDSKEMEFTQLFIGSLAVSYQGQNLILTHSDGTVSTFESK